MKLKNPFKMTESEYDDADFEAYEAEMTEHSKFSKAKGHTSTGKSKTGTTVVFRELFEHRQVVAISQSILEHSIVICNMQRCDNDTIQRILDFLSGVAYSVNAEIRRSGDRIFICAPCESKLDGKYYEDPILAQQVAAKMNPIQEEDGELLDVAHEEADLDGYYV